MSCEKCGHGQESHSERGCFAQSPHGSGCCTCGGFVFSEKAPTSDPTPEDCAGCVERDRTIESLKESARKNRDTILAVRDLVSPKKQESAT